MLTKGGIILEYIIRSSLNIEISNIPKETLLSIFIAIYGK